MPIRQVYFIQSVRILQFNTIDESFQRSPTLKKEILKKINLFLHSKSKKKLLIFFFEKRNYDNQPFLHCEGNNDGNRLETGSWRPQISPNVVQFR